MKRGKTPENSFLKEKKELSESLKREIIILYGLGVNIDEIAYLMSTKFRRTIELKKLIDFLFSSI